MDSESIIFYIIQEIRAQIIMYFIVRHRLCTIVERMDRNTHVNLTDWRDGIIVMGVLRFFILAVKWIR